MHNMSTKFYSYIADLLLEDLNQRGILPGERYALHIDNNQEVFNFVESLKQNSKFPVKSFEYPLQNGEIYNTFVIKISDTNLIIASTAKNTNPDFLVTLRNLVGEQKGQFQQTSLLSVLSEDLDSVLGGSSNLEKEGMPLHADFIYKHLKKDIKNRNLSKVHEVILTDSLESLKQVSDIEDINFFDFEEIFITLQNGEIEKEEYHKFGLFPDNDLKSYSETSLGERINKNKKLFSISKGVHDYGLGKDELEKYFGNDGANLLFEQNWLTNDFTEVYKFYRQHQELNKKTKIEINDVIVLDNIPYIKRSEGDSAGKRRRKHVIVFSNKDHREIKIQIAFTFQGKHQSLSKEFMKQYGDNNTVVDVKTKNIFVTMKPSNDVAPTARIRYRHDHRASLGGEVSIIVVPFHQSLLEPYRSRFLIHEKTGIELQFEDETVVLGKNIFNKTITIDHNFMTTELEDESQLTINFSSNLFYEDNKVTMFLKINDVKTPITFVNELPAPTPRSNKEIWNLIRKHKTDAVWMKEENCLLINNQEYYIYKRNKKYFEWERKWIENNFISAILKEGELKSVDLQISARLKERFLNILNYFTDHPNKYAIPSFSYITEEFASIANDFIEEYYKEIKSISESSSAGQQGISLLKLGIIYSDRTIFMTPFHPLLLAYKLKTYELLRDEDVSKAILDRLNPESLIPFIFNDKDELFRSEFQQDLVEWILFKPAKEISITDSSNYLSQIVSEKIKQFKEHFNYLFLNNSNASLQINIINIRNDMEILKGIIEYLVTKIDKDGLENIHPVDVNIYNDNMIENSSFDLISSLDTPEEIENAFNISFSTRNRIDKKDVLQKIQEKLTFYKRKIIDSYDYAHITFYNMHSSTNTVSRFMTSINTGLSLDGIYSNIPSMRVDNEYYSGYGVKMYQSFEDNNLLSVAYYLNELAFNCRNDGNNVYGKGQAIFSKVSNKYDSTNLKTILDSTNWLVFIDPHFDLDFLNNFEEMLVIHYNDQYTSSNKYDAITVTEKYLQYYSVIKTFLSEKGINANTNQILSTIKTFNTFNGEWLLRVVGSRGYYDREKLSLISAIKYALSFHDHKNILWVPISMEEILRVAGVVGLRQEGGIFSSKNINLKGYQSDDILFIGLEEINENLYLHFYPIEVKAGINNPSMIEKGIEQVLNTKKSLLHELTSADGKSFTSRFYRNFFVQLFLSNAKRIEQNKIWPEKNYNLSDEVVEKLLKDDFKILHNLRDYIGDAGIVSFKKETFSRSQSIEKGVMILQFEFDDAYRGLIQSMEEINQWLHEEPNDFIQEEMLANAYEGYSSFQGKKVENIFTNKLENSLIEEANKRKKKEKIGVIAEDYDYQIKEAKENSLSSSIVKTKKTNTMSPFKGDLENSRIRLGTIEGSSKDLHWEYGHKSLANRHMLISGKSGQGKTYFMQCILLEKSRLGIPSIVVDYTDGFLPAQLEPKFVEHLGDKIVQRVVTTEKFPINPFRKNIKNLGGIEVEETSIDIAERIKGVFSSVYTSLGVQQLNAIYEAVLEGVEKYDQNMNLDKLKKLLEESNSRYAATALSQIRPFIDRNPFDHEQTMNWNDILNSDGHVYIIQLVGYSRDVQMLITEFILWDLWDYSERHGSKDNPIPVVLDESQNLDHTRNAPTARILTEGRKFGWSAWTATQFLRSQLSRDELSRLQNASQKVYFAPPEEEISYIASTFSRESSERKYWEEKLSSLKKGQCIVYAPVMKSNGELSAPVPHIVNILSLEERI